MMKHALALLLAAFSMIVVGQVPDYVPNDGLVGWWPLDGNGENAVTDGLDFDLTNVIGSKGYDGGLGAAISFNGESSMGQIHENVGLVGEFSLSIWIRSDLGIVNYNPLFHIGDAQTCENEASQLEAYVGNGGLTVVTNRTSPQSSDHYFNAFSYNTWTHLGLRLSDGVMTMFLDGEPFETWPFEALNEASFDAFLGFGQWIDSQCVTSYYEGEMDNLGLWNRALSDLEMAMVQAGGSLGCTDPSACNYNPAATSDAGNCVSCELIASFCGPGTTWDSETQTCIVANPADTNLDGCVQLNDLLDVLSAYGDCGTEEAPWACGDPLSYQGYDYATVQIGDQCWFAENLRAENYRNGDLILLGNTSSWESFSGGGAAIYPGNNGSNVDSYGMLYNWFTIEDSRGICPSGWVVPSDSAFGILELHLGIAEQEIFTNEWRGIEQGDGLKSSEFWDGSDAYGFGAVPSGGVHAFTGVISGFGIDLWLWTSTENTSNYGRYRHLKSSEARVERFQTWKNHGGSIRCLKDAE